LRAKADAWEKQSRKDNQGKTANQVAMACLAAKKCSRPPGSASKALLPVTNRSDPTKATARSGIA